MCLTTEDPRVRVAEEDIKVYKTLNYGYGFWRRIFGVPLSMYERYPYKKNQLNPTVNFDIGKVGFNTTVHEGYHSYPNKEKDVNALFIIPKGASYIVGEFDGRACYVSDRIIYKKRIR